MSKTALDICHKNQLWTLVKKVGQHYQEDSEFLKEYAKDIYENGNILQAIDCFKDLVKQFTPETFKL